MATRASDTVGIVGLSGRAECAECLWPDALAACFPISPAKFFVGDAPLTSEAAAAFGPDPDEKLAAIYAESHCIGAPR